MSLTITPRGLLVRDYDTRRRRWTAEIRTLQFCDLLRKTNLEPGTTLSDVFDLVSQNPKLIEVLNGMCFVNVAKIHDRPRVAGYPLVRSDFCKVINKPDTEINEVLIEKHLHFDNDQLEGVETPDWLTTKLSMAVNAADWSQPLDLAWSMPDNPPWPKRAAALFPNRLHDDEIFGGVVNLPLRLRTVFHRNDQETPADIPFTMWEILVALYGSFGETPAFWEADQPRITEAEDMIDLLRGIFDDFETDEL